MQLVRQVEQAEQQLQATYPRLFITNDEIQAGQRAARKTLSADPNFRTTIKATATAVRMERDYLLSADSELEQLHRELFGPKE